jgi:hypothetical protein
MKTPFADRLYTVMAYLEMGGKVKHQGHTFVWLKSHVTHTVNGVEHGIDGLAIEGVSVEGGKETPHYLGANHMSISHLRHIVESLDDRTIKHMAEYVTENIEL